MSNVKISELDAGTTLDGTELIPAVQSSSTVYTTPAAVLTYLTSAYSGATEVDPAVSGDLLLAFRSGVAKTIDVNTMAALSAIAAQTLLWGGTTRTTVLDADSLIFDRGGTVDNVTAANLAAYVLDGVQANVLDISGLDAASLTADDNYLIVQSGVAKKTTLTAIETKLWADLATYVAALSDVTTLAAADKFYVLHSGTAYYATPAELMTYVGTQLAASDAVSPWLTGDKFLMYRSGTAGLATIDDLQTYLADGLQATILNVSGLDSATLAATDYIPVCQATTAKQTTAGALATFVHSNATYGLAAYVAGLSEFSTLTDADKLYVIQSGTGGYVAADTLANYVVTEATDGEWTNIPTSRFTALPPSSSTLTMSDTTGLAVGLPVRYTWDSTVYYGIITAVSVDSLLTIAGAPLDVSYEVTKLEVGVVGQVTQMDLLISESYSGSVQDILENVSNRYLRWRKGTAYLVAISATHAYADTGSSQPIVNVKLGGSLVSTDNTDGGIELSTAGTWVDNSAVGIDADNYDVARDDAIEVSVTDAGDNNDASVLSLALTFVSE